MKVIFSRKSTLFSGLTIGMLMSFIWIFSVSVHAGAALSLENGFYQLDATLEGGTGKTSIENPTRIQVEDGKITAWIVLSSEHYDYMLVDGEKYLNQNEGGNSTFEIPVKDLEEELAVTGDTLAMSEPHEIDYVISFDTESLEKSEDSDWSDNPADDELQEAEKAQEDDEASDINEDSLSAREPLEISGLTYDHRLDLTYATCFSVDYYEGGYKLISILDEEPVLLIPQGMDAPENLPENIRVLNLPIENIYLVATSAMDFFEQLDALDTIRLSGTQEKNWYVQGAAEAMAAGDILFAGKYSAPDYELILSQNCGLAIESTMIYHNPEVREELESLGIPVLVEHSSYEADPLGRMEWIYLYGALTDKEDLADEIFREKIEKLSQEIAETDSKSTGDEKTVAFFYINSSGIVNVRKSSDYIVKMIEMAGGKYIFEELGEGENSTSSVNMQMEEFYATAKDADYIIYNSTIDGQLNSISDLFSKSELLADFKAVKEGHVYCTSANFFQKASGLADFILDIHHMLTDDEDQMIYLYRLT